MPGRAVRAAPNAARAAAAALALAFTLTAPPSAASDPQVERGRALYHNEDDALAGARPVLQGAPLPAAAAACVNCHRRSGLGGVEGSVVVPPVAGRLLFRPLAPQTGQRLPWPSRDRTRPAYDDASLGRALRDGHAPDDVPLRAPMPRYALPERDVAALAAYLRSLSSARAPGVDDEEVVLATITTPDVPSGEVADLLGALSAFFADKNAGTRNEVRRRAQALRNDETMYRRHRRWRLEHWALSGSPGTWAVQLAARYAATPVFAVLSGLSYDTWSPVHAFCESRKVPCLLPMAWAPPGSEDFYSVYFSPGLPGLAQRLAEHLANEGVREAVAWVAADDTGARQREVIRAALARTDVTLVDRTATEHDVVVSALGAAETVARIGHGEGSPSHVYVFDRIADALPDRWRSAAATRNVTLVTDLAPAEVASRQLARARAWLAGRRIAPSSERVAVNALLAATIAVESLMHVDDSFSREYCIEKLEHNLENVPALTAYPRLSIGPGKRFASRRIALVSYGKPPSRDQQ